MSPIKTYNVNAGNMAALLANQKDNFAGITDSMTALRTGQNNIDLRGEMANLNMDELTQRQVMALNTGQDLNEQSLGALDQLNERAVLNKTREDELSDKTDNRDYEAELLTAEILNAKKVQTDKNTFSTNTALTELNATLEADKIKAAALKLKGDLDRAAYRRGSGKTEKKFDFASINRGIFDSENALKLTETMPINTPEERKLKAEFAENARFARDNYRQKLIEFSKQSGANSATMSNLVSPQGSGLSALNGIEVKALKMPNTPAFRNAQRMQGFENAWNDGVILETKDGLMIGNEKLTQGTLLKYLMSR